MPGLRMHLTVDRVREIIRVALVSAASPLGAPYAGTREEDELVAEAIEAARAITYDPAVRGALGGFAKARAHPAPNGASNATRAKRRAARLAKNLEEESRIGTTRITR